MPTLTNYIAFVSPETGLEQIGHLDLEQNTIQPLSFVSGTPVQNLYQIIEAGSPAHLAPSGPLLPASAVKVLPPISGRDVLAVGKNYLEHAREFNRSGYDSSDKVDRPSHPVIFTKRATSIVAHGDAILLHGGGFTSTTDYEGEIGVIVGKAGFRIPEADAWDYVWGYTIVNDVTARERQRDHKQFFIGKSADTYCPMGPIAVPKEDLPKTLRVQTHVNGEPRQDSTTDDLIFPIPELLAVLSSGQTLQPGDVLATGTPAGVGIGRQPPVFLQAGDVVSISVTGLGTLTNRVAHATATSAAKPAAPSALEPTHAARAGGSWPSDLATINGKRLSYRKMGSGRESAVFAHGLGGTKECWLPLVSALSLHRSAALHLYDFEGHGLSPTHPLRRVTVESLAADLAGVFGAAGVSASAPATLFAHSLGCLAALRFALANPRLVKRLVLLDTVTDPPAPEISRRGDNNHLAAAAARLSLLGQDPEGYAKGCQALADAPGPLTVEELGVDTLIVTGRDDGVSTPAVCEEYVSRIKRSRLVVLEGVGCWPLFEDVAGVAKAVAAFVA
ncbi:putative bifunctional 4-hydroxyphenylacetate degradation enzyme [Rosellinia necatrix]|uniref:Putative bifunctional 4-hydroxyphenylacetate degradation enzyme n=1 Tax=Rosellinia necatrix TaxID=77044 RepID=A0A1S8A909_ROSNE|nr:putative bifunctional 4-hydroxyphenylacetate degradation enzyme [Rosellinia necatrix]